MKTKKTKVAKTATATSAAKRSPTWHGHFHAALTGIIQTSAFDTSLLDDETEATHFAASSVRAAEKIADIAEARNS